MVHVVGAGVAGLACATALAGSGHSVTLYEATGRAGGRCRSYPDPVLGRTVDNGNHLILGGNPEVFRYLDRIGARDRLIHAAPTRIPFRDLEDGTSWTLAPGPALWPFWLLDPHRRVPGAGAFAHVRALLRLILSPPGATVADRLDPDNPLTRRLLCPLAVSILNTEAEIGSARLLGTVIRRTLVRGEAACRPHVAREGLSHSLVDPAVVFLERHGVPIRWNARLTGMERDQAGRVLRLRFGADTVDPGPDDRVVLALPPDRAAALLPDLAVPTESRAILNAHFRLDRPIPLPGDSPLLGVVGGTVEWIFSREDVLSVTVSAADRWMEMPVETLGPLLWQDVARALDLPGECPVFRIVKEKRATFAARPGLMRAGTCAPGGSLYLAGDWTDTGLPATIEGAVQSGHRAADLCRCPVPPSIASAGTDQPLTGIRAAATRRPSASRML